MHSTPIQPPSMTHRRMAKDRYRESEWPLLRVRKDGNGSGPALRDSRLAAGSTRLEGGRCLSISAIGGCSNSLKFTGDASARRLLCIAAGLTRSRHRSSADGPT